METCLFITLIQSEREFRTLKEGMSVQFDLTEGEKGFQAQKVVVIR